MSGEAERWQLDGGAPELYQRYLVPAMTAMWADDLADRVGLCGGERVLDVACGTGVVARVAAERVGPTGRVDAVDLNRGMLSVAMSVRAGAGVPIEWHEASVLALPFVDATFGVALCQLGLQFFSDRSVALQEMRRVLEPAGRVALSVFSAIEQNPAPHALVDALDRHIGAEAAEIKRSEHSLADREGLCALVAAAGFREVVAATSAKVVRFPSVADYVRIQFSATPLAGLIADDDFAREQRLVAAVIDDVGSALAPYCGNDGLTFPQEIHSVIAHK